jgi:hypothetical protein
VCIMSGVGMCVVRKLKLSVSSASSLKLDTTNMLTKKAIMICCNFSIWYNPASLGGGGVGGGGVVSLQ